MSDVREAFAGRVIAVFNTGSRSCDASSQAAAQQIFQDAGLPDVAIHMVAPAEVGEALKAAVAQADVSVEERPTVTDSTAPRSWARRPFGRTPARQVKITFVPTAFLAIVPRSNKL